MPEKIRSDIRLRATEPEPMMGEPKKSKAGLIAAIAVIIILTAAVIVGAVLLIKRSDSGTTDNKGILESIRQPKEGAYQAVFLTNGQVYFGKLSDLQKDYARLTSIYYLRLAQSPQPEDKTKNQEQTQQNQLTLIKLGGEIHGPEDEMLINSSHILFVENLKEDGKVVEAIKKYEEEQKNK